MSIEYYELSCLTQFPFNSTLEDWHKHAWAIFKEASHGEFSERPFVFRIDPINDSQCLTTIRSAQYFSGSRLVSFDPSDQLLNLRLRMVPTRRRSGKDFVPDEQDWNAVWQEKLQKSGLTEVDLTLEPAVFLPWAEGTRKLPVVDAALSAKVADPVAFSKVLSQGVGRRKAYGMGMLQFRTGGLS